MPFDSHEAPSVTEKSPSKFAAVGKGLGEGIRNFKSAMKQPDELKKEDPSAAKKEVATEAEEEKKS